MAYADPERQRERQAEYRAAHRERACAYSATYYSANRERIREYQAANRARSRETHRAWKAANPERYREWKRAYRAAHPEHDRRVARREELVLTLLVHQLGECGLCRGPIVGIDRVPGKPDPLQVDHITPKSRGGTNHLDNLRVVHSSCNLAKRAARDPEILAMRRDTCYRCADCGSTRLEFAV